MRRAQLGFATACPQTCCYPHRCGKHANLDGFPHCGCGNPPFANQKAPATGALAGCSVRATPIRVQYFARRRAHLRKQFFADERLDDRERIAADRPQRQVFARVKRVLLDDLGFAVFDHQHGQRVLEQLAHIRRLPIHKAREHLEFRWNAIGLQGVSPQGKILTNPYRLRSGESCYHHRVSECITTTQLGICWNC
jgi:hypothetical protein